MIGAPGSDLAPLVEHFTELAERGEHDEALWLAGTRDVPAEILEALAHAYPRSADARRLKPKNCEAIRLRVFTHPRCPSETKDLMAEEDGTLVVATGSS